MNTDEQGYMFAEIVATLFILSILLSCLIPFFQELKNQEWEQSMRLEAISLLQERMERLSSEYPFDEIKGGETQTSRMNVQQTYRIQWQTAFRRGQLVQIDVEVQWQNNNTKKRKTLKATTYRYQH
jgi:Tfp pilus assembly protein PilE